MEGRLAPFGDVIGYARNMNDSKGIEVYSCDYDSANRSLYRSSSQFVNVREDGVFFGFKYQCVEFARRWLVLALNVTFESIDMAYEGFDLTSFKQLPDMNDIPIECIENGSIEVGKRPVYGNVIIWNEGGYFRSTGHIGIITEATDSYVRIAEQNYDDLYWPKGQDYSRELPVLLGTEDGSYSIVDSTMPEFPDCGVTSVRGWIRVLLNKPEANTSSSACAAATATVTTATSSSSSSTSSSSSSSS